MIEVFERLHVGNAADYETIVKPKPQGWAVVHACKEPYHREALGYSGRGAPQDHEEYLFAERHEPCPRLACNLVDVPDVKFIRKEIIDNALGFIRQHLEDGLKVLVHCNQGHSRAPSIALLYLRDHDNGLFSEDTEDVDEALTIWSKIYPAYAPAKGMADYVKQNWPGAAEEAA